MREKFLLFDADNSGELSSDELDAQHASFFVPRVRGLHAVCFPCKSVISRSISATEEDVLKSLGITPSRKVAAIEILLTG